VQTLQVYPENMKRNLYRYGGVIFSQQVLLALVEQGMTREEAYALVQTLAHQAWNQEGGDFRSLVEQDATIRRYLSPETIAACFDPQSHLHHLETIYQRLNI
jgi:adenylosuccinate lyase